ncbi:hypothetical protein EVAR_61643_1 [Eumeta japonica]|uniref:Uncharacterized protein n=1 Tax=Eumeta variegata TaxID=151549 RepID=A0A4C1Z755_EUMVA|nr:hypothetical protein EVAR_61643_1 [Eumeta japonica]
MAFRTVQRTKLCRCEVSHESVAMAGNRNTWEKKEGSASAEPAHRSSFCSLRETRPTMRREVIPRRRRKGYDSAALNFRDLIVTLGKDHNLIWDQDQYRKRYSVRNRNFVFHQNTKSVSSRWLVFYHLTTQFPTAHGGAVASLTLSGIPDEL